MKENKRKVMVLDTTLRDGEQIPGAKLNGKEKLEIARQLKKLNVDIIEAGFPISSPGDFKAVKTIAREVGTKEGPIITGLARAVKEDIERVYESVKYAHNPLIHIVLGSSDVHIENKFGKDRQAILEKGVKAVEYASSLLPEVQYSTEDASRTDFEYLWQTVAAVIKAGATVINIPDTVGYAVPGKFARLILRLQEKLGEIEKEVRLSVHCHNDTGLATANTLAAIKNGASQVECTINGIGERAGNAALEEVVMGLRVRPEYYGADTEIVSEEIRPTSRLVSRLTGLEVQVNKAITGDNAFAHSSGIHQDGVLKSRDNYEIISPSDVGCREMEMVLTARSGRHAVKAALGKLGYEGITGEEFDTFFENYLQVADNKKEVYYVDLFKLAQKLLEAESESRSGLKPAEKEDREEKVENKNNKLELYSIGKIQVVKSDLMSAVVEVYKGDKKMTGGACGTGIGPVEVLYQALGDIVSLEIGLKEYKINSLGSGKDARGRVKLEIEHRGNTFLARAIDDDILAASARAYINGVNKIMIEKYAMDPDLDKG